MEINLHKNKSTLLNKEQISNLILRLSHEIIESQKNIDSIAVVGIRTRGEIIAKRIIQNIYENYKKKIDLSCGFLIWKNPKCYNSDGSKKSYASLYSGHKETTTALALQDEK